MDLLEDSALVGFNNSSTSRVLEYDGVFLGGFFCTESCAVWNWGRYWPWRVGWNWRSSRTAVSMQQCVMPILASETVVNACALPELMGACKAIWAQLLSSDIRYSIVYRHFRTRGHIRTGWFFFEHRSQPLGIVCWRNLFLEILPLDLCFWTGREGSLQIGRYRRPQKFDGAPSKRNEAEAT